MRQQFTNRSNMFYKEMVVYSEWMPDLYRMQREVLSLKEDEVIKLPYPPYVHGACINFESEDGKFNFNPVSFNSIITIRILIMNIGKSQLTRLVGSLENFILMEDIKKMYGFRMTNRREALDIHHMRLVMEGLAKVHSLSWAYRHHVEPNIAQKYTCMVPNFGPEDMEMWTGMTKNCLTQAAEILDEILYKGNK